MSLPNTSIQEYFKDLPDPRKDCRTRHLLMDILSIVLCAMVGGAETFNDIELFARSKPKVALLGLMRLPW